MCNRCAPVLPPACVYNLLHHTVSTYGMIIQSVNVNRCVSVCLYLCVKKLRAQTTGHRPSQTGWARNVLTSPHTLPVHSYSSSFLLKSGLYTPIRILHTMHALMELQLSNQQPGCGSLKLHCFVMI